MPVSSEPQQRARPITHTTPGVPTPTPPGGVGGTNLGRVHDQPNNQCSTPSSHPPAGTHGRPEQAPKHPPPTTGRRTLFELLRKEVIQPHLPVRLPCYDFVPITSPTFDRSPHTRWLGHGLRVLPTFVT